MKLIYRAHIYGHTPGPVQPYIKPRAINWRFQSPVKGLNAILVPSNLILNRVQ